MPDTSLQQRFTDLVYEHQGALHRICSVYAMTRQEREDLSQEILMQSWRAFPSFRGQSKFSTWFYRVALNTALLYRRKEGRLERVMSGAGAGAISAVAAHASETDPRVELLYECIQELPPLNRAIVLLHLERHTYEEIGEITGLSRENVSVRLVRLKEDLKRRLIARGYREE